MAIRIDELKPGKTGAWVIYRYDQEKPRRGRIKYWNQQRIFVVFDCAHLWDRFADFVAIATDPNDLDFV